QPATLAPSPKGLAGNSLPIVAGSTAQVRAIDVGRASGQQGDSKPHGIYLGPPCLSCVCSGSRRPADICSLRVLRLVSPSRRSAAHKGQGQPRNPSVAHREPLISAGGCRDAGGGTIDDKLILLKKLPARFGSLKQPPEQSRRWSMYRHILIPTDGSELAEHAVTNGLSLAKSVGAKITVIIVEDRFDWLSVPETRASQRQALAALAKHNEQVKKHAANVLGRAADAARQAGVPCDTMQV